MPKRSLKHYSKVTDFDKEDFIDLFRRTDQLIASKDRIPAVCAGKVAASLFFQPSTRTSASFQSGIIKLGGGWIGISGTETTAMSKGESFEDTIGTYAEFADLIAIRHPDDDAAERAAKVSNVPIINAGCGSKEHPGAFLYFYPCARRLNKYQGLKYGIYGTPGISRCTKSLVQILGMFNAEIYIDDLGAFPLSAELEKKVKELGAKKIVHAKLDDFIREVDVLLVTDIFHFSSIVKGLPEDKVERVKRLFKPITPSDMKKLKKSALLTTVTPRVNQIDTRVDKDPRAIHIVQNEDFLYLNMALITKLLNVPLI